MTLRDRFVNYLAGRVSPAQLSELYECMTDIDDYCCQENPVIKPFDDGDDLIKAKKLLNELQKAPFFYRKRFKTVTLISKYIDFLQSEALTETKASDNTDGAYCYDYEDMRTKFDRFETAVLIYFYVMVSTGRITVQSAWKRLSDIFREYGRIRGLEVDENYRNITGMQLRMSSIAALFNNKDVKYARPSALDREIFDLYMNKRDDFDVLLREAREKMNFSDFSEPQFNKKENAVKDEPENRKLYQVDYEQSGYSKTQPVYFTYFYKTHRNIKDWRDLYIQAVTELFNDDKPHCRKYVNMPWGKKRYIHFKDSPEGMFLPHRLDDGIYIETDIKPNAVVCRLKSLLDFCGIKCHNLDIYYCHGKSYSEDTENNASCEFKENRIEEAAEPEAVFVTGQTVNYEPYIVTLRERFSGGLRFGPIDIKRFKDAFKEINSYELNITPEELKNIIGSIAVCKSSRYYLPDMILPKEDGDNLLAYIDNVLNKGNRLYYRAILDNNDSLSRQIYDEGLLKEYLKFSLKDRKYIFRDDYIVKSAVHNEAPYNEVNRLFYDLKKQLTVNEVCEKLPHIAQSVIQESIRKNKSIICGGMGREGNSSYIHSSSLILSSEDIVNIKRLIVEEIRHKTYITGKELWSRINDMYPDIVLQNPEFTYISFRDALKLRLKGSFDFKFDIISVGKLTRDDIFRIFCRDNVPFTIEQLKMFSGEIEQQIPFNVICSEVMRINSSEYVQRDYGVFDCEKVDARIDCLAEGRPYISIKNALNNLPEAQYVWNEYLVEEYASNHSSKYRLLNYGFVEKKCCGAIVLKSLGIDDFDTLLITILAESGADIDDDGSAADFLKSEGYIAKTNGSIKDIVVKAREMRNRAEARKNVLL